MKKYQFNDVFYMKKEKTIEVLDEKNTVIGRIKRANISGCETDHSFSFDDSNSSVTKMGIQKRGFKNFLTATYVIETEQSKYFFKDKVGNSLLYFCVDGNIDKQNIRVEENWSEEIEIKIDQMLIATIKINDFTFETTIITEDYIQEPSLQLTVIILMYFMYVIYKKESGFIESILFD